MLKDNPYVSPTQRKKALKSAGYRTGRSIHQSRCDQCIHVRPDPRFHGVTKYDRHCALFETGVKTHGTCSKHEREVRRQ